MSEKSYIKQNKHWCKTLSMLIFKADNKVKTIMALKDITTQSTEPEPIKIQILKSMSIKNLQILKIV